MPSGGRPPPIRAVLFDLGGTLIDERDPILWAEEAGEVGLAVDPEALAHWYEETERENDRPEPRWGAREFWGRVLSGATGTTVAPALLGAFLDRFRAENLPVRLFSDVRGCLEVLQRRRLALGVVSNSRSESHVRSLLERVGITGFFSVVVSSGTEGVAKPSPEIFRRAVDRLEVRPEETVYVGDLRYVDALASRAAGLAGYWLRRDGTGFGEDPPELTSLSELPLAVRSAHRSR